MKTLEIKKVLLLALSLVALFVAGCEKDSDGPLEVSSSKYEYYQDGFFRSATLDNGRLIHLLSDTLYLKLDSLWTFDNCSLESIDMEYHREDTVLVIEPKIKIHGYEGDCASPFYRPDTTFKILLAGQDVKGATSIKVRNDEELDLDSILLRRGKFQTDTFYVYLDSSFADPHKLPLRTKETKADKPIPTILRVLDSLTPRKFYWRTMKTICNLRVDMCDDVVPDTLYPSSWSINDTNLVPVRYSCADSTLSYCINSKWENDSSSLGDLQERPDTIWHQSTYYMEKIPKCSAYDSYSVTYYNVGQRVRFIRKMMVPDETEMVCGPSSSEEQMVYNMNGNRMVVDRDTVKVLDTLNTIWSEADVAPDTLIVKK